MPDSVSNKTRAQIDALCKQIAVAHDLNPEIQDELAGHMEDKLLGYLNGQELLTEDDAFILVREHFGDPAEIKTQLQNVHSVAAGFSLVRCLCAVSVVHLVFLNVTSLVHAAAWIVFAWLYSHRPQSGLLAMPPSSLIFVVFAVGTYAYWWTLRNWKRRMQAGELLWFQRWHGTRIGIALVTLACFQLGIPRLVDNTDWVTGTSLGTAILITIPIYGCIIAQACIWLWWCDTTPRRPRTLTIAGLVWLTLVAFPWWIFHVFHLHIYSYDPSATTPDTSGKFLLWHVQSGESSVLWLLQTVSPGYVSIYAIGYSFATAVFTIAIAKFIYIRLYRA